MFKCLSKKCECRGIGILNEQTFANICPKCRLKKSFVTFFDVFNSLTVEEPNCFKVNGVKYLTTSGIGVFNNGDEEIKGIYTLILVDANSSNDGSIFSFVSIDTSGNTSIAFIFLQGENVDITVDKCSGFCTSKKPNETLTEDQLSTLKNPLKSSTKRFYAKLVTFHANGKIEEEDISNRFKLK